MHLLKNYISYHRTAQAFRMYLVRKIEGKLAKFLMITFAYHTICCLFYKRGAWVECVRTTPQDTSSDLYPTHSSCCFFFTPGSPFCPFSPACRWGIFLACRRQQPPHRRCLTGQQYRLLQTLAAAALHHHLRHRRPAPPR